MNSFNNLSSGSNMCRKRPPARFIDFDSFVTNPVAPLEIVEISDVSGAPTNVAEVSFENLLFGDKVWLNGLFHVDNDNSDFVTIDVRIFRDVVVPGQEIYRARIEIDEAGQDDFGQPIPVQTVDTLPESQSLVTYIVTVSADDDDVFLNGPVTLTGVVVR